MDINEIHNKYLLVFLRNIYLLVKNKNIRDKYMSPINFKKNTQKQFDMDIIEIHNKY